MNPGRRINRPQRGSRARLVAAAFAVTLLVPIAAPRPVLAQAGGYDDDGTTVVGSASGGVTVDLSVLNDLGAPDRGRDLRFPGSRLGPDQAIRLHPARDPAASAAQEGAPRPPPACERAAQAQAGAAVRDRRGPGRARHARDRRAARGAPRPAQGGERAAARR